MPIACYQCSTSWLTSCWCSYPKITTNNSSKPMIQAKYIFTISIDDNGKRTINCELPPHDLETERWLQILRLEIDNVFSYCVDMYNDVNTMLLEFKDD